MNISYTTKEELSKKRGIAVIQIDVFAHTASKQFIKMGISETTVLFNTLLDTFPWHSRKNLCSHKLGEPKSRSKLISDVKWVYINLLHLYASVKYS